MLSSSDDQSSSELTPQKIEQIAEAVSRLLTPVHLAVINGGDDDVANKIANEMAAVSQKILNVKNIIGETAYPTGTKFVCSPRFWITVLAMVVPGASMLAFNSSLKAVTEQGDVIFTDWIPFSVKEILFYFSATMATNLPINLNSAVQISFNEAKRLYGDLKLFTNKEQFKQGKII